MIRKAVAFLLNALFAVSIATAQSVPGGRDALWERAAFGGVPGVALVKLYGVNPGLTTTFEPMWGESNAYTPLVAAMSTPYCASSSANDASAGTGARTISVKGVNTSFVRFSETVTLNGTSSVNLATANVLFIDDISVLTAGSGLVNAGIIQCGTGTNTSGDPAVPHAYLGVSSATAVPAAGAGYGNVSQMFFYAVPADNTLICRNIGIHSYLATTVIGVQGVIDVYAGLTGVFRRYWHGAGNNAGGNPAFSSELVTIPGSSLVIGKMAGTAATVGVMSAECLLIENSTSIQQIFGG